ncbi:MAG TPA: hypothetical protein VGH07_09065 [Chthoniobacterales bacterium]
MEPFLTALHHFTAVRVSRVARYPIDSAAIAWLPVIGVLTSVLAVGFYVPLASLYFPIDVAVVPAMIAVSWLRGFKPEIDFCQLCDLFFGQRRRLTERPVPGVPGVTCLVVGILLKYAILRQFYLVETVRLLTLGIMAGFIAPLLRPAKVHRWIMLLGFIWLVGTNLAVYNGAQVSLHHDLVVQLRGPVLSIVAVYLSIRLAFSVLNNAASPNVASFIAELTAYLSFVIVRYHFL